MALDGSSWSYFIFEIAGIFGTILCGWLSDKVFKGRRAPATIIYMALVMVAVYVYWQSRSELVTNVAMGTIGFLIYWITSIKQRELLFGIYRAMGMSMHEINKMLINEQMFSSVLASLAGYGVGAAATALFVKLVAVVYLPEAHNIAISITVNLFDILKLTIVIVVMFVICFIVLRTILKKMNITQALKLGED